MENKKAYIYALIGQFGPQAISLITNMVLARLLLPETFGAIAVLNIFLSIASVLMDSGLGGSLVKEKEIKPIDCSTIFVFNLFVSLILYLIVFIFAAEIENFYHIPDLRITARLLCLCFVINSFGLVPKALLTRNVNFKGLTEIHLLSFSIASVAAISIGLIYRNVYALLANQLINSTLQVIFSIYKSGYKFSFKFSIESFRKLFSFGVFTTMTSIIDSIYENIIVLFFGKIYNAQQAGYVGQAKKLEELSARSIAQTVNNVAFPILVKYRDDRPKFLAESNRIFKTLLAITSPALITIAIFSEEIILLLFGTQWIQSAEYLSLLIFAGIFILCESLNRNFIKSLTLVNLLFKITIWKRIVGILLIIITAFITPEYILHVYILSSFIGFLFNNRLYSKSIKISFWEQLFVMIKILFPSFIYYIIMTMLHIESSFFKIAIASLFLLVYYFGILPMYDIHIIEFIKRKK